MKVTSDKEVQQIEVSESDEHKNETTFEWDLDIVEKTVDETLKWLESNKNAKTEEYDAKQKQVEDILMPIVQKAYKGTMPPDMANPSDMPDMTGMPNPSGMQNPSDMPDMSTMSKMYNEAKMPDI